MDFERTPLLVLFLGLLPLNAAYCASDAETLRVETLFRPYQAEAIALSPDGQHVAFTQSDEIGLKVIVVHAETGRKSATFSVDEPRALPFSTEKDPARMRFLEWATPARIVFAPTSYTIPAPPIPDYENGGAKPSPGGPLIIAPIYAADANGGNPKQIADARAFEVLLESPPQEIRDDGRPPPPIITKSRLPTIIGFEDNARQNLLVEVRGFRQGLTITHTEVHRIDISTGKTSIKSTESPSGSYQYDRQGNPRIFAPRGDHAQDLLHAAPTGTRRWKPVPEILKDWPAGAFRPTPESYFGQRSTIVGFGYDPNSVLIASTLDRDTYALFESGIEDAASPRVLVEHPTYDLASISGSTAVNIVVDEHTRRFVGARLFAGNVSAVWLDDELRAFQTAAEAFFPGCRIDVLQWNAGRTRLLLKVTSGANPGRYFVFVREERRMREVARAAPWLDERELGDTHPFKVPLRNGQNVTGYLTLPRAPKVKSPPVVMVLAPGLPATPHPIFDEQAHVLANMGYAVVRINQRGTEGFGRRFREELSGGVETAALADALAVIDWLRHNQPVDTKRVALLGEGFSGFLALKATSMKPDAFRCAVAIDAPIVPGTWLPDILDKNLPRQAKRARLKRTNPDLDGLSLLSRQAPLPRPAFLGVHATRDGELLADNRRLRTRMIDDGAAASVVEFHDDFDLKLPQARARFYAPLGEFLNAHLYDYNVQVGESVPVPGQEKPSINKN